MRTKLQKIYTTVATQVCSNEGIHVSVCSNHFYLYKMSMHKFNKKIFAVFSLLALQTIHHSPPQNSSNTTWAGRNEGQVEHMTAGLELELLLAIRHEKYVSMG